MFTTIKDLKDYLYQDNYCFIIYHQERYTVSYSKLYNEYYLVYPDCSFVTINDIALAKSPLIDNKNLELLWEDVAFDLPRDNTQDYDEFKKGLDIGLEYSFLYKGIHYWLSRTDDYLILTQSENNFKLFESIESLLSSSVIDGKIIKECWKNIDIDL